jgi:hypothetical protein
VCQRGGSLTSLPNTIYPSVSVLISGNGRKWVEIRVNTPLECMVKHFNKGFNGDNGVKLTPNKLKALGEVDCATCG